MGLVGEEYLGSGSASLLPQGGVLPQEGFPLGIIRLEQPFLGTLKGESQPVQIVQAGAAAQADTEALGGVLADHFPVPVGQFNA